MPLTKSKSGHAFSHNIKAEMHAGKPQKQAVAIAYAVKRKAQHMADGGEIEPCSYGCVMGMDGGGAVMGCPIHDTELDEHEEDNMPADSRRSFLAALATSRRR